MITLEILTNQQLEMDHLQDSSLGIEIDATNKSDRYPSLWQENIINSASGLLIHIFDREFYAKDGPRWLYEAVTERGWERFWFKDPEESDFFGLLTECISKAALTWLLCDAQFGPRSFIYKPHSMAQFGALYKRAGIRINSAMPLVA